MSVPLSNCRQLSRRCWGLWGGWRPRFVSLGQDRAETALVSEAREEPPLTGIQKTEAALCQHLMLLIVYFLVVFLKAECVLLQNYLCRKSWRGILTLKLSLAMQK